MRVLTTVSDWAGHYFSLVPTCWALQAAGHDVRVACVPAQADAVAGAGLTPAPVLDGLDLMYLARVMLFIDAVEGRRPYPGLPAHPVTGEVVESLDDFDLAAARQHIRQAKTAAMGRSFDGAVELARSWRPDLVLHDPLSNEGVLAAQVTGVPAALHLWGPMGSAERDPAFFLGPPDASGSFARYGQPPMGPDRITTVIDPSPADLEPPVGDATRLPVRYVPYNGPGRATAGPPARVDRPRVCVVWGNSAAAMFGVGASALPRIVAALAQLDVDVVLTTNRRELDALGPVPSGVHLLERFPLHLLLSDADLVIHHGSANCSMTAAAAGVPQLAVTMSAEQAAVSRRFDGAGCALSLAGFDASTDDIRAAAAAVLTTPSFAAAAGHIRTQMRDRPTPAELVPALEAVADRVPVPA